MSEYCDNRHVNVLCVYRIVNDADIKDDMVLQQNDTSPHPIQLRQNACYEQYVTLHVLLLYTH